jgi:hypothetical protein
MNIESDQSQSRMTQVYAPKPFVPEKDGVFQFRLVLFSVALVTVVWVGVVIFFCVELFRRAYG